jgi:hypothetical protein
MEVRRRKISEEELYLHAVDDGDGSHRPISRGGAPAS